MSNLLFNNWLLLGGLLAVAIPVIIHLLLKRRPQRLRFSTLRFFKDQDESAKKRRRLRNLLLLSLRMLLVALLVLAFARPYLMGSANASGKAPRRYVVGVVDRSASMRAADHWQRTIDFLREQLKDLTENDRVALVACGDTTDVLSEWVPPGKIKPVLDELKPGLGGAQLAAGLTEAAGLVASREGSEPATVLLVSDLQSHSCGGLKNVVFSPETELRIEAISERELDNVSITELKPSGPGTFAVGFQNWSGKSSRTIRFDLVADGGKPVNSIVLLPAGVKTNVVLSPGNLAPGWHQLEIHAQSNDALDLDDDRYLAVNVPQPLVVWCVEAGHPAKEFEQETFFLRSALSPTDDQTPYYLAETVSTSEVFGRLQKESPALILLSGLHVVPPELPAALQRFTEQGGGLILFVGESVRADRYNIDWHGLLPANLGRVAGDLEVPEEFWHLSPDQTDDRLFTVFRGSENGDIAQPFFKRRFELIPGEGANVLAIFGDGKPFVIAKERGRGRVVLVNTSADTGWNDWPKRRTFVPWVHSLAGFATGQTPWLDGGAGRAREWGTPLVFEAGNSLAGQTVTVRDPAGEISKVTVDNTGGAKVSPTRLGVYSLLDESGKVREQIAMNLPVAESALDFLSPAEIQSSIKRVQMAGQAGAIAALMNVGQKELWRIILGTGLVLLLAESLLANRTWA
ncbi:VWA domain-containing protein [bacterium]|nr:VWA domain-containing protein [bacterium]